MFYTIKRKKWQIVTIVMFVGTFAFLGLALARDWHAVQSFRWQFDWLNLIVWGFLHSAALGTLFLAWHLMMRRLTGLSDWRINFSVYSFSILARRIPLSIWYAGSRLYLYRKQHVSAAVVVGATTLEVALITLSGVVCYVLLLPKYTFVQDWLSWPILVGTGGLLLALVVRPGLFVDLVSVGLRIFKRPSVAIVISRRDLLVWGLIYLATWFLDGVGVYYVVAALFPSPPPLFDVVGVSTISALVALLALILPGGFGLKELTMGALLGVWMPIPVGIALSILYRLLQTALEIIWALMGYWVGDTKSVVYHAGSLE